MLDTLHFAQYPLHSKETLSLFEDSLQRFDENKQIFVDLGIRNNFNINKLHFLRRHYIPAIKLYGTTDNYNTEYTERLHIDLVKDAYRATNRKTKYPQMTVWLERREKIFRHDTFMAWRLQGSPPSASWEPPPLVQVKGIETLKGFEYGYSAGKVQVQGPDTRSTREVPSRVLLVFFLRRKTSKTPFFGVFLMFFAYLKGLAPSKIL
jgi:hypothetical protein